MNGNFDEILDNDIEELDEELPHEDETEDEKTDELRIGVIGFDSDDDFVDEELYDDLWDVIYGLINEAEVSQDTKITIVSNGLNNGVSRVAYEIADEHGFKTVAIYPASFNDNDLGDMYAVDMIIEAGDVVGDDDEIFIDYIDALVVVGKNMAGDTESKMQLADENEVSVVEIEL